MASTTAAGKRPPARRKPPELRRVSASDEARSGLAGVTRRLDEWVSFFKLVGWVCVLVGGTFTLGWNFVGKPYAQQFVAETVQQTIGELQASILELRTAIEAGKVTDAESQATLKILMAQIEVLQATSDADQETSEEILKLLRQAAAQPP